MSLKEITRVDKSAWIDALQAASSLASNESFADIGVGPGIGQLIYDHRLDQVWVVMEGGSEHWLRYDPLMTLTGVGASQPNQYYDPATGYARSGSIYVGEHDPVANIQRIYGTDGTGADPIKHIDPNAPWEEASPSYTDDTIRDPLNKDSSTGGVQNGQRQNGDGSMIFFESAEPATWPNGYALQADCTVRENNVDYDHVLAQIDLADEGAGPTGPPGGHGQALIVPTANWFDSSPSPMHPDAHAGPLAGYEVGFDTLQFAPDDDSTPAAPKGRLFLFNVNIGFVGSNSHRDSGAPPGSGTWFNKFVKVIEWNPTGKAATAGNVNRVNLREVLLSRMRFKEDFAIGSGGIGLETGSIAGFIYAGVFFHPPTETIRLHYNAAIGAFDGTTSEMVFSLQPALASLSLPTSRNREETGKTLTFESTAEGDLGERISGLDLAWELDRRTTKGEELASSTPGGTVFVDHFPIDGVSPTDSSLVVYEDGTPLTVTTHYTVVLATGEITGVGAVFDSTKVYTVDYEHQETGAQPPNGILRTTLSTTDGTGRAIARIEAPDDATIVGERDALDVTEA
jgi:hypothetical protein